VALRFLGEGGWRTVRLLENAHGQHDVHRYTGDVKQPAERFLEGTPQEAFPQAIRYLAQHWEAIAQPWNS
jgi:hypothetical protein